MSIQDAVIKSLSSSIRYRISYSLGIGVTGCLGCLQSLNLLLMWNGIHWVANTRLLLLAQGDL